MGFRIRLGPFTFGRSGIRLSLWSRGTGVSVPLSGEGRSFGKISVGPVSYYTDQKAKNQFSSEGPVAPELEPYERTAIQGFQSDGQFLRRIRKYGVPWRGAQERLKIELPDHLADLNTIAYKLVPLAMKATFGPQGIAWATESRPSKNGKGQTTWLVVTQRA